MPAGSLILSAHSQGETICLWARVNRNQPKLETRIIEAYGTGEGFDEAPRRFIGTVLLSHGSLVYHIFERTKS
jgi:hypothetical protein